MNPRDLVLAAVCGDDLSARQFVKDAARSEYSWGDAPELDFEDLCQRAVYAGLVELLASRKGQEPPSWTRNVGPAPRTVFLLPVAETSKAMRRMAVRDTPAPLLRRNVLATGQYLDVL